ncbi:MAG: hypothetical protein AAGI54_10300 [Planctomycetota bacterium]
MALRNAGAPVLALDADPARALMTRHNAGCPVACADIANLRLAGRPFHLDPARLQHQLRGNAPADPARTLTVFVLRWDRSLHATVTRRL